MPNQPSIPVTIRPMDEKDLEQVSAVEKDAFPDLFPSTAFAKELKHIASKLGIPKEMLSRSVNEGFSGGEKNRYLWLI